MQEFREKCLSGSFNAINVGKGQQIREEKMDSEGVRCLFEVSWGWKLHERALSQILKTQQAISRSEILLGYVEKIIKLIKNINPTIRQVTGR